MNKEDPILTRKTCFKYQIWLQHKEEDANPCIKCMGSTWCSDHPKSVISTPVVNTLPRQPTPFDGIKGLFISNERPDWNNYFMNIAVMVSLRSTCLRRKYGAVIVDPKTHKIISTGFNGAPSGHKHCLDTGCERQRLQIPHGQQYEKCVAVHAEQNALIAGNPSSMDGAVIYISGFDCVSKGFIKAVPCEICLPMLQNAHIRAYISTDEEGRIIETKI